MPTRMRKQIYRYAITGGIGAGKSHVCQLLGKRGIAVYDCDEAAQRLMSSDIALQDALSCLVGSSIYQNGRLRKDILANFLLKGAPHKQAVNEIVHPAVALDFLKSGFQWLESAILFDSGFYQRVTFDRTICVSAPLEIRIKRIMERDFITEEHARQWIESQMSQSEIEKRTDFVIINDGKANLETQIDKLLSCLH